MAPIRLLFSLGVLLTLAAPPGAVAAGDPPRLLRERAYRGIAVLSSSVGKDVPAAEIEAFVAQCRIDLVVFDFAWVTHHFPRTDLGAVEALSKRLQEAGVVTAAMYRPRALRRQDADVHFARDAEGGIAADHLDLCFAHEDSVAWGASWGERILAGCPSLRLAILYNVRAPCRCTDCAGGAGTRRAAGFIRACRDRWRKVRPDVLVGHVGLGTEYADEVDFLCPFAPLNREEPSRPVDAARIAAGAKALRAKVPAKPFVPLLKVCWESETRNSTEDVAAALGACGTAGVGFLLWYYEWVLHPEGGRYDPEGIVRALGGSWDALRPVLARPEAAPAADPNQWIYFDSRETATGPFLRLSLAGGEREAKAEADTVLISYLADRAWGSHRQLSVSLGDSNRVLLRFPVASGRRVARAEVVLRVHLSQIPPGAPFELAVHAVEAAWDERTATWNAMPAFAKEPAAAVVVEPREGELRVDVSALAAEWAAGKRPNHGLLLKAARPLAASPGAVPAPAADRTAALLARALRLWSWADSPAEAAARARSSGRAVLAVVTASFEEGKIDPQEEILLATVLSHPAVVRLGRERLVPVRVSYVPWRYTGGGSGPDPLTPLGTGIPRAKAPALVVASGEGKILGTLESLGTFDHGLVLRFLDECLERAGGRAFRQGPFDLLHAGRLEEAARGFAALGGAEGAYGLSLVAARRGDPAAALDLARKAVAADGSSVPPALVEEGLCLMRLGRTEEAAAVLEKARAAGGERSGEAAYWLASILLRDGEEVRGRGLLEDLAKREDDPFALKAALRLAWAGRLALHEILEAPALSIAPVRGEVAIPPQGEDAGIRLALEYLLREQRPDGSWPVAEASGSPFVPGVTVFAARALLAWRGDLVGGVRERADRALARADAWLAVHVARADPGTLNSFAAAYHLDYALDRHALGLASREEVAEAIRRLQGGACANGAWSYDRRFGEGWKGGFGGWPRTDRGRTHSMNTGLALLALGRAAKAGFEVDRAGVEAGVKALLAMRVRTGVYTYTWPEPRNFEEKDFSVARAPVCEHALFLLGKSDGGRLRETLDAFLARRADLRRAVKLSSSWLPPHCYSAYFYFFAYHHAAEALADLGGPAARRDLAALREDLMAAAEPDGTWVDDASIGKPYGTAAALLVLRRAAAVLGK